MTDAYYEAALDAAPLSVLSKRTYHTHLRTLRALVGKDIDYIVRHPKPVYAAICAKTQQVLTRKSYINSITTLFRHLPGLAEKYPAQAIAWRAAQAVELTAAAKRYDSNEPTDKQRAAHVPWADVLKARDALPKASVDYLLLCMFTKIPPLRADFDRIAILHRKPTAAQVAAEPNYLVVSSTPGADGVPSMTLVLNEFKTKGARLQQYFKDLPEDLCAVIHASLEREPRSYLFVSPLTGERFNSTNAYGLFVMRILRRVFAPKRVNINTLRHSFVSALPDRLRVADKDAIARDMLHSPAMQDRYKLYFDDVASSADLEHMR
jgi:hypothetical protein